MRSLTPLRLVTAILWTSSFAERLHAQDQASAPSPIAAKIHIDPAIIVSHISPDFIGFGYETSAVAQSNFFTGSNATMLRLFHNLSPHGLIRIGGNVSDHTKYEANGVAAPRSQTEVTIINRQNLDDLGQFARAAGWRVMWGLNLGTGSKEEAVREALAVNAALGTSLQSFEIGNEVEALRRFAGYDAYHAAFLDYKRAIRAVLPDAPFSGPDSIGNLRWVTNFADTESADIKLLTIHYYRGGAGEPKSTLARLLAPDEGLERRLDGMRGVGRAHGVAFRINEVNSYSGGGKVGVSDTFGSALWCLDFMFRLASYGCDGVNMETDINHLAWISHYSPIVHDAAGHARACPEYYGMLAFAFAGKGVLVRLTMDGASNLTAYATKDEQGLLWLTVINKDFSKDASVKASVPGRYTKADCFHLQAPTMASTDQVSFAGSQVSDDGAWSAGSPENLALLDGAAILNVAHASAIVLCFKP